MATLCTSCGEQLLSPSHIYKCRQCVNHFLCEPCTTIPRNRAIAFFHTFDKILTPIESMNSAILPSNIGNQQLQASLQTLPSSSIFESDDYLTTALVHCNHCHRIFSGEKETFFKCDQCPSYFAVCTYCLPLMPSYHPAVHKFSEQPSGSTLARFVHDIYHLDAKCDGCSAQSFNGNRYQCEQCVPSYDLCENCFGKIHTHHSFKLIQKPMVHANNQEALAERTLALAKINGDHNWRDPLTGWTKVDAKHVLQQAKEEQNAYKTRLQEILLLKNTQLQQSQQQLQDEANFSNRLLQMQSTPM